MSSWAAVRLFRTLRAHFDEAWRRTPDQQLRRWAAFVLIGVIAVLSTLFVCIAFIGGIPPGSDVLLWEIELLRAIERGPIGFSSALWLQTLGTDFTLMIVVLVTSGLAAWNGRPLLAISIVLSVVFMDAVVRIGWFALERSRPQVIAQGLASPGFHSFPSGHTAKTIVLYGLLAAQWWSASRSVVEKVLVIALAIVLAIVVPYGRVRMGAHWPTDILGGYLLAAAWLTFILLALRSEPSPTPRA